MKKHLLALAFATSALSGLSAEAATLTPQTTGIESPAFADTYVRKVWGYGCYGCGWHSRYRSHWRWGSGGWGYGYGWGWHGRYRSHWRWGSGGWGYGWGWRGGYRRWWR